MGLLRVCGEADFVPYRVLPLDGYAPRVDHPSWNLWDYGNPGATFVAENGKLTIDLGSTINVASLFFDNVEGAELGLLLSSTSSIVGTPTWTPQAVGATTGDLVTGRIRGLMNFATPFSTRYLQIDFSTAAPVSIGVLIVVSSTGWYQFTDNPAWPLLDILRDPITELERAGDGVEHNYEARGPFWDLVVENPAWLKAAVNADIFKNYGAATSLLLVHRNRGQTLPADDIECWLVRRVDDLDLEEAFKTTGARLVFREVGGF